MISNTLFTSAILASVPCILVTLLPGIRGVRRTETGTIVGPVSGQIAGPAAADG